MSLELKTLIQPSIDLITKAADDSLATTKALVGRYKQFDERLSEIEQKSARRGGIPLDQDTGQTLGAMFANSDALKEFVGHNYRGTSKLELKSVITSAIGSTGGALGGLVAPDRAGIEPLARRPMTIRSLCKQSRTTSNQVSLMRQSTRTNAAAMVPETQTKPESAFAWDEIVFHVGTLAHTVPVTRQILEDAPSLSAVIDGELRYGLQEREEDQLLFGNGAADNLAGLYPQATDFVAPFEVAMPTPFDRLIQGLAQASVGLYKPSAIILNTSDAFRLHTIKDTVGRYIGGGPYEQLSNLLWSVKWVGTNAMPKNQWLLGDFANAAEIFDRTDAKVMISDSHLDWFAKNQFLILAEQRLTLVCRSKKAFIRGVLEDPA